MRTQALSKYGLILLLLGCTLSALAQTRYWTGGSGSWSDATHWSAVPGGQGGAGVPNANTDVVIDVVGAVTIQLPTNASCHDLNLVGGNGELRVTGGARSGLTVSGSMALAANVDWAYNGELRLTADRQGVEIDLRGIPLRGNVVFSGTGPWSVLSDLVINNGDVVLEKGTVITNGNLLKARALVANGRSNKRLLAGRSVVMLERMPTAVQGVVDPGASILVVNGSPAQWGIPATGDAESDRDINVCGTGPGQTPFIVNAQLTTNFNGFGVQCRGQCNATVTATVSGGVGSVHVLMVVRWPCKLHMDNGMRRSSDRRSDGCGSGYFLSCPSEHHGTSTPWGHILRAGHAANVCRCLQWFAHRLGHWWCGSV